jgi:hypothetical protein
MMLFVRMVYEEGLLWIMPVYFNGDVLSILFLMAEELVIQYKSMLSWSVNIRMKR